MLPEKPLTALLDDFSSPSPTPGGGSASALSAAVGMSLLTMVAGMTKTRTGTPQARAALDASRDKLLRLRGIMTELIDRDASAYDLVMAAYRRPKETDEDKAARKAAIQSAMRWATDVPLETMRVCADALAAGLAVAEHGNVSAKSDMAVGIGMLMQALQGAFYNVEINLESLSDAQAVESITESVRTLLKNAGESIRQIHQTASFAELLKATAARVGSQHGH